MNKCLLSGIGFALIFGLSVCLYSQFLPETLTAFFTKDPAVVAMAAEYLRGYSIPEDMSIIGFDDIPFSAVTMPALTTMRISRSAMGMLAVDMIRKRIKYPDWPGMHMLIGGKLIVRNSTRPKNG